MNFVDAINKWYNKSQFNTHTVGVITGQGVEACHLYFRGSVFKIEIF